MRRSCPLGSSRCWPEPRGNAYIVRAASSSQDDAMDPLMHLVLPLLFLLALRVDTRRAVLLAPLAVLPDLDALFGLHRALGHSFIPIVLVPMAVLVYSKLKRPEWVAAALI